MFLIILALSINLNFIAFPSNIIYDKVIDHQHFVIRQTQTKDCFMFIDDNLIQIVSGEICGK